MTRSVGNIDVGFEVAVLIHRGEQRGGGDIVAQVHRDIAHDAVEGGRDVVVAELLSLALRSRDRGLVIGLGVLVGLFCLVESIAAGDALLEEFALPLHFNLVVLEYGQLLLFRRVGGGNRRLLFSRVDFHQQLAGLHAVAGVDIDPDQVAVDLGINGCRATRLDGGDIFVVLRNGSRRDGLWFAPAWPAAPLAGAPVWRRL